MIEIPESRTMGEQADNTLIGKTVAKVVPATSPYSFTWYNGDPAGYDAMMKGHTVVSGEGHGAFLTLHFDGDVHLTVGDGTNVRYYPASEPHPLKHQLLIEFTDGSFVVFTVSMYGAIYAYKGKFDNPYYVGSIEKLSPLDEKFDKAFFDAMMAGAKQNLSAKAFLATEQRIPGLGNGVLQDILFNAKINPKKKISALTDIEKQDMYHSVKTTLQDMADKGGRDTEKDLFGEKGGYRCLLSKNTYKEPCPHCDDTIVKEAYLGGAVYYCPACQPLPPPARGK